MGKKNKQDNLKDKVKQFLKEEGMELLSEEGSMQKAINSMGSLKFKAAQLSIQTGLTTPESIPEIKDALYCMAMFYHESVDFLTDMVWLIDKIPDKNLIIAEGGCSTGIESLFLAEHYRGSNYQFQAYDRVKKLIKSAEKKRARRNLNNILYYVADNFECTQEESQSVDVLFTKRGFEPSPDPFQRAMQIKACCQRVKQDGFYVWCSISGGKKLDHITESILSAEGISHIAGHHYHTYQGTKRYNHVFKVKATQKL